MRASRLRSRRWKVPVRGMTGSRWGMRSWNLVTPKKCWEIYRRTSAGLGEAAEYFRAERRSGDAKNRIGAATNLAGCLATRAMVLEHQGNAPEMLTALTEAEQILREGNSPDNLGRTLLTKSRVYFSLSQFEQGIEAVKEAVEIFSRIENFPWLLKCVEVQIRLAMQLARLMRRCDLAA